MLRTALTMVLVLVLLCPSMTSVVSAGITSLEELEKTTANHLKDVKQVSTDVVQTMDMGPQGKMVLQGTLYFELPELMRMTMKTQMMGQEMLINAVHDGQFMWTETPMGDMKQVMKMDMNIVKNIKGLHNIPGINTDSMNFNHVFYPLKNMKEYYKITWLGQEKINDLEVMAVEATLTEQGLENLKGLGQAGQVTINMGSHYKLFFDPASGFMKKMSTLNKQGQEIMSMEFSNFNLKPELSPDFFKYTVPEGVKVMDLTPMMKDMLENMTKTAEEKTEAQEEAKTETATEQPSDTNQPAAIPDEKKESESVPAETTSK
ncbi:outer membrane lipoprotein carrier protein LolA [bacterium]|nr:outer membrane lipoprotein carrier protein LolA [bacterium]